MTTTDTILQGDARVLAGSTTAIMDLTAASALGTVTVRGAGDTDSLSPIAATAPEIVAISSSHQVSMQGWRGDTIDMLDTATELAVLLTGSGRGWILPGAAFDTGGDAPNRYPTAGVAATSIAWQPSAAGRIIDAIHELDGDDITVAALSAGQSVMLIITVAGTVGGTARTVGIHSTTITAGTVTVAAAVRGWLCVVTEDTL